MIDALIVLALVLAAFRLGIWYERRSTIRGWREAAEDEIDLIAYEAEAGMVRRMDEKEKH